MPITNIGMYCGMIEMNPGSPPTPIAEAWTLFSERKMLPRAEPVSYTHLTLPTNREV